MSMTDQPVAQQVAAFDEQLEAQAPEEVVSAFRNERVSLDGAGVPKTVSTPGSPMPDGQLLDVHGASTTARRRASTSAATSVT